MTQAELLAEQLQGARDWTLKLIADLKGNDWGFQPGEGLAHPLWMCGHLASAQNTLVHVRCIGQSVVDESFTKHFPLGTPVKSVSEHKYPSVQKVLDTMKKTQDKTVEAIRNLSDTFLAEPASGKDGSVHPHYRDKRGAISHCSRHEAFHAGQLATIRRLLGRGYLR